MNNDIKLAGLVLALVLTLFVTTLLLDWPWIAARWVRQVLVYALMILEAYMFVSNILVTIKNRE